MVKQPFLPNLFSFWIKLLSRNTLTNINVFKQILSRELGAKKMIFIRNIVRIVI